MVNAVVDIVGETGFAFLCWKGTKRTKMMDFSVAASSACDGLAQLAFSTFWAVKLRSVVLFGSKILFLIRTCKVKRGATIVSTAAALARAHLSFVPRLPCPVQSVPRRMSSIKNGVRCPMLRGHCDW